MNHDDNLKKFLTDNRPTPKKMEAGNQAELIWNNITREKAAGIIFNRVLKYAVVPALSLLLVIALSIGYRIYNNNELYFELGRNLDSSFNLTFLSNAESDLIGDLISITEADPDDDDDDDQSNI